jgi:hypothetical protein
MASSSSSAVCTKKHPRDEEGDAGSAGKKPRHEPKGEPMRLSDDNLWTIFECCPSAMDFFHWGAVCKATRAVMQTILADDARCLILGRDRRRDHARIRIPRTLRCLWVDEVWIQEGYLQTMPNLEELSMSGCISRADGAKKKGDDGPADLWLTTELFPALNRLRMRKCGFFTRIFHYQFRSMDLDQQSMLCMIPCVSGWDGSKEGDDRFINCNEDGTVHVRVTTLLLCGTAWDEGDTKVEKMGAYAEEESYGQWEEDQIYDEKWRIFRVDFTILDMRDLLVPHGILESALAHCRCNNEEFLKVQWMLESIFCNMQDAMWSRTLEMLEWKARQGITFPRSVFVHGLSATAMPKSVSLDFTDPDSLDPMDTDVSFPMLVQGIRDADGGSFPALKHLLMADAIDTAQLALMYAGRIWVPRWDYTVVDGTPGVITVAVDVLDGGDVEFVDDGEAIVAMTKVVQEEPQHLSLESVPEESDEIMQ